jgi:hypothetical protein
MPEFFEDMKLVRVKAASGAAQTAVDSDVVDMAGYDAVLFFTTFGAITAGGAQSIKVQQSADSGGDPDTFADLLGTGVTVAADDDGQTFGVQIIHPRERYLRLVVSRATQDSVVGEIYALLMGGDARPISSAVTNAATFESHYQPAEGTA